MLETLFKKCPNHNNPDDVYSISGLHAELVELKEEIATLKSLVLAKKRTPKFNSVVV